MDRFKIDVFYQEPGKCVAVVNNGEQTYEGRSEAEALGHAMFALSCSSDMETGVMLDITNEP